MGKKVDLIAGTIEALKREEGFSATPYQCTAGVWTIGYGFTNLTQPEAAVILEMRVKALDRALYEHGWYRKQNDVRKGVLIQMAFQLGLHGLLKFHRMIDALEGGFYQSAAAEMRNSRWFQQTPDRATRLMDKMFTGR